eukprot:TRINITY_DN33226_c0_g1_i1.p1 TRINITY_DN33226_c0_g1~~TRINITY_DN33226_c0_g1_i1.p1  ORF type:complete len:167 (-),score=14.18 TRINITY_DN33226_c0_g1_i1:146-646(-)
MEMQRPHSPGPQFRHSKQDDLPNQHQLGLLRRLLPGGHEFNVDQKAAEGQECGHQMFKTGLNEQPEHAALLKQLLSGQAPARATTGGRRVHLRHQSPVSVDPQVLWESGDSGIQSTFCAGPASRQQLDKDVLSGGHGHSVQSSCVLSHAGDDARRLRSKHNKIGSH